MRATWMLFLTTMLALTLGCPTEPGDDPVDDDDTADDDTGDDDTGDDDTGDDDTTGDDDAGPDGGPDASGIACVDTEPNDFVFEDGLTSIPGAPVQDCPALSGPLGLADRVSGTLDPVLVGDYTGDNDTYHFFTASEGPVHMQMSWSDPAADLDWYLICWYEEPGEGVEDWFIAMPYEDTLTSDYPQETESPFVLPADSECYLVVLGWTATGPQDYEVWLWNADA